MQATTVYVALYLSSVVAAVAMATLMLRTDRPTVARKAHAVLLAGTAVWSLGGLFNLVGGPAGERFGVPAMLPAVGIVVAAVYVLSYAMTDGAWRPTPRLLGWLAVHPVVMLLAATTDTWHQGILVAGADGTLSYGALFWVHSTYSYGTLALSVTRLFRRRRQMASLQSRQMSAVLAAWSLPVLGNVVTLSLIGPDGADLTPVFFVLTALVVGYAVLRQGITALAPIARSRVFEHLAEAVLVLDPTGRLVDANRGAADLLGIDPGRLAETVGLRLAEVDRTIAAIVGASGEHPLTHAGETIVVDVQSAPLWDRRGHVLGSTVIFRDVTLAVAQRHELAAAHDALVAEAEVNERLRRELAEQVVRDAGTGLHNRHHLSQVLPGMLVAARQHSTPVSVAMVDIDHFKQVNDTYGHAVGDRVLAAVAREIAATAGPDADVVRYGGEEFLVALPGVDHAAAFERAEAIRLACAGLAVAVRGAEVVTQVSCGVATSDDGPITVDGLIEAADAALYEAKRTGRNRTCVASGTGPTPTSAPTPAPSREAAPSVLR